MLPLSWGATQKGAQLWTGTSQDSCLLCPHASQHGTCQPRRGVTPVQASRKAPEQLLSAEDFNLATAVAMGAASFESYNPPYRMHGIKEVDDNHSETVYMQRPFLDRLMAGILQVHLRRGEGLRRPKDKHDKTVALNPRFMLSAGPSCGWSTTHSMSTDPIYGETLFLYVRNPIEEPLQVRLMHCTSNPNQESGELGRASFSDMAELCDGEYHEIALDLEGEDGPAGKVFLGAQFMRHSEEEDVLSDLPVLATGQMMSDDWGWDSPPELDWYNNADYEWRSSLIQAEEVPVLTCRDSGIDITGLPAGTGNPIDRPPWKMWTEFREAILARELTSSFEPFAFLAHVPTDSEVWIYVSDDNEICIAFRGTESPADMIKDAVFDLAAFSPGNRPKSRQPEEVAEEVSDEEIEEGGIGGIFKFAKLIDSIPFVPQLGKLLAKSSGGRGTNVLGKPPLTGWVKAQGLMVYSYEHNERWVHNGFLQTYLAVQQPLLRMLDEIMDNGKGEKWHIYCTGHSMGGALACLAAYEISSLDFEVVPKPDVSVYTFGSPRVGNIPFAEDYDKQVPATWRVSNENDIVTRIPSLLGYRHVGIEVKISKDGKINVSQVSSDQVREGTTFGDMLPRIKEGITGQDEELKSEFRQLIKGEWEVSQALMRGHAIQEHMEDKYHDILKACVDASGDACKPDFQDVDKPLQA